MLTHPVLVSVGFCTKNQIGVECFRFKNSRFSRLKNLRVRLALADFRVALFSARIRRTPNSAMQDLTVRSEISRSAAIWLMK